MAKELQDKKEEEAIKKKGSIVWQILSYINVIFFAGVMIYLAIDLSKEYLASPETVENAGGWSKNTIKLEPFTINLADRDISYLLRMSLQLEPDEYLQYVEARNKTPQIRDIIINILMQKKYEEIRNVPNKEKLKRDVLKYINSYLTTGRFKNVFFTEFVIK